MRGVSKSILLIASAASFVQSISIPSPYQPKLLPRQSNETSVCSGNTADDRSVWCDYDLSTNYYEDVPNTGVTKEYWFEITNSTLAPDGVDRVVLSVNGSVPGPTIEANWGDTVIVHVTNSLQNNGTGIHFHGIRQNWTNPNDGVPSITQCPTAPGDSITYTWKATQYGSSWYHSHYSLQAWEGVFGGIVIYGPASGNYDEDLGVLFLNDWDHQTSSALYTYAETQGPPTLDTGLINGTNMWLNESGSYWETSLTSGSSYLLRIVNGAIDTHFDFMIDNHTLTVISADFVPIEPYTTETLSIGMGQRYDVIVTADQSSVASDFWLRAIPDTFCSENSYPNWIRGIVHYGDSTATPTTTVWAYDEKECFGEPAESLVPSLQLDAGSSSALDENLDVTVAYNSDNLFKWYIGGTTMAVEWADPSALQIINNETDWTNSSGVIEFEGDADTWAYIIIQTSNAIPHPIHLHGHDFYQLAQGTGTYESANPTLQTTNPIRRDVTMLPASGYVVIAFAADNPGAWLCHCHIGWHTEEGFALQFIERYDEIASMYNTTTLETGCSNWEAYTDETDLVDEASGV
ncbi:multicopper oxidase [Zasmidium cellare ATCC 36951]|uniref:Multicopper oxidase n=1 Tax=Zasmidium cellare ATCC 36951 TaxID=1080233 RepID=A0A6A6C1T5_ZASCE|nr:multicopper oxidase [Zasmidium cellare ATCC 36951]KAF2160971.1 multicopper oxidase [Zasmidium cellare ATCC 36951]